MTATAEQATRDVRPDRARDPAGRASSPPSTSRPGRCSARRSARSCARPATSPTPCSTGAAGWSPRPSPARPAHQLARHGGRRTSSRSTRSTSSTPGDVLITNDPYKTAGQLLDVTVLVPVWRNGRPIALFGSTIHHTDVGGYGIGAGGRDVFEEGLWIPIVKLMRAGRAQRRRVEVHPLQRPPARPHGRRPPRPDGVGRGRRPAPRRAVRPARPRRHRGARRRDHRPLRGRHPRTASASCRPARTTSSALLDLADGSRIEIVCALTVDADAGEITRRLHRARPRPARGASTSCATTPTPTRRSRCARCSTRRSRTTTAASRRSR